MGDKETREAINIYRKEHETWNVERLMSIFDDNIVWHSGSEAPVKGKAAVRAIVERMAANPAKRRMYHDREFVQGNEAAVEWHVEHLGPDGAWHPYRFGVNVYEVVNGKIKLIRLYGFLHPEAQRH